LKHQAPQQHHTPYSFKRIDFFDEGAAYHQQGAAFSLQSAAASSLQDTQARTLWTALKKMLSPIEYLLFNINMVFLVDSYFEYQNIQRAANLIQSSDTMPIVHAMMDLQ